MISLIIFCLISEGINLPLSISSSFVSELFFGEVFETVVILSAILFRIKSPVASAVFWIALFKAVLSASVASCLAWSRSFWLCVLLKFLLIFLSTFLPIFLAFHSLLQIFDLLVELNSVALLSSKSVPFFIYCNLINN